MKKIIFSKDDNNKIINLYLSGKSCKEIGIQFNCSKQTINSLLKNDNISIRDQSHCQQKYNIDEDIFSKIDTQEKAYWLGMLTGDGWITDNNDFGISLQELDKKYVYKFRDFLKSNHPINIVNNGEKIDGSDSISYEIRITNKKLVSDLRNYGFTSNKTHHMSFPKIADEFLSSYILGLVDSDGCFCLKSKFNNPNVKTLNFSFIGPTEFVEKFQQILIDKCNVSKTKLNIQKSTDFIRVVHYGGYKHIFSIVKFIYSTSLIYFDRKRNIALEFLIKKFPNDTWLLNQSTGSQMP